MSRWRSGMAATMTSSSCRLAVLTFFALVVEPPPRIFAGFAILMTPRSTAVPRMLRRSEYAWA